MVKILDQKIVEKLFKLFYPIDFYHLEEIELLEIKKLYSTKSISVFDHWLKEDEYTNASVMHYRDSLKNKQNEQLYEEYETKFLNFYSYLYDSTIVYGRLFGDGTGGTYVEFKSKDIYLSHVLLSIREELFLKIVLPEYHAIIDGGHDLTHILRVKKKHAESLEKISKIVHEHGLYILE
jgi:hypothetical protein